MLRHLNNRFVDFADWVSWAIGTPLNMGIWMVIVGGWLGFWIANPTLANSDPREIPWLPPWAWQPVVQLPLNGITTLLELWLCFLAAAATSRAERNIRAILGNVQELISQHTALLSQLQHDEEVVIREATEIEDEVRAIRQAIGPGGGV